MLAGLGQDSLTGLGSTTAVLLPGVSSLPGIVLTGGSPKLGPAGISPASSSGTGGARSTGPVLLGGAGSTVGVSPSRTTIGSAPIGPVLMSGSGAATNSAWSGAGGSSDLIGSVLLSQYTGGSSTGTQGTGTNAGSAGVLWSLYGAGSSSGSDNGSLASDPTISAKHTGDSGGSRITPLVYNPRSEGPPVFVSGVLTGNEGGVQFVPVADPPGGRNGESPPAGRPTWNDTQDDDFGPRWKFEFEAGMGVYDPPSEQSKPNDEFDTIPTDESGNYSWLDLQAWNQFLAELRKMGKEFAWHMADWVVPDVIGNAMKPVLGGVKTAGLYLFAGKNGDAIADVARYMKDVDPHNAAAFQRYTDSLRAAMSRPPVTDPVLNRYMDELSRANATVGNGSTAAAVRTKLLTGEPVGGVFQSQKAQGIIIAIKKWLENSANAPSADRAAAKNVLRDIQNAFDGM